MDDNKILKIVKQVFSPSLESLYYLNNNPNYILSDIDIIGFYNSAPPSLFKNLFLTFTQALKNNINNKTIYLRWSTSAFFEPLQISNNDNRPIIFDILLIRYYKRGFVSQLGFEAGILSQMLKTGKLIHGKPLVCVEKIETSSYFMTLRHYFQHNISKLIELSCKNGNPFYIVLNSTKILGMACYKLINVINQLEKKDIPYDKLKVINVIANRFPNMRENIQTVKKYLNTKPYDLTFADAEIVYEKCFLLINQLFAEFMKYEKFGGFDNE